jgi:tetratricopeptide (TPR) repeat protein
MKTHSLNDWIKAGNYYRGKESFEKAIEAFAQARLALLTEMGECFTRMGELEDARVLYEEVIEADIRNVRANAGLGIVYLLAGFPEEAALAFGNVLHVDPHEPKALCGLGMVRLKEGQYKEGVALLQQSLDEAPDNVTALNELATFAKGADGEQYRAIAAERCRKHLERHPDAADVRTHLKALETPQHADAAGLENLASLIVAFQQDPYQRLTVLALAEQLGKAGQRQDGKNVCSAYLKRYPEDGEVLALQSSL